VKERRLYVPESLDVFAGGDGRAKGEAREANKRRCRRRQTSDHVLDLLLFMHDGTFIEQMWEGSGVGGAAYDVVCDEQEGRECAVALSLMVDPS